MLQVSAESIGIAHRDAVAKICKVGIPDVTEDGEHVVKLEEPLCIHVSNPRHDYSKFINSPYGKNFDEVYKNKVIGITFRNNDGLDPTYTYGNRFRDYLQPMIALGVTAPGSPPVFNLYGDGDLSDDMHALGYDQLVKCLEKLRDNPSTRRAVMSTWIPWMDHESNEPPCVMVVSFEINKAKELSLVAFIRSNDILMAWGENAIGLTSLQHYVSRQLGLRMGYLETISRNAHVYFKRDQNYLRDMGVMYDI